MQYEKQEVILCVCVCVWIGLVINKVRDVQLLSWWGTQSHYMFFILFWIHVRQLLDLHGLSTDVVHNIYFWGFGSCGFLVIYCWCSSEFDGLLRNLVAYMVMASMLDILFGSKLGVLGSYPSYSHMWNSWGVHYYHILLNF